MQNDSQRYMIVPASPSMPTTPDTYYRSELEETSHLRDYWHILKKRKWWFLGVLLGTMVITLLICLLMSPIYKVTSTIQIIQDNPSAIMGGQNTDPLAALSGSSTVDKFYETQYNILQSPTLALNIMDTLKLQEHPSYKAIEKKYPKDPPRAIREKYALYMLDHLNVEPVKNSFLVNISYKSTDQNLAWKVAETIPKEYLKLCMATREQSYSTLRDWLAHELTRQGKKLEESERTVYVHGQKQDFLSLEDPQVNVMVAKYLDVSKLLTQAQSEKANKEAQYRQIKEKGADAPLITNHPLITQLRQGLIDLEAQASGQSKIFGAKYPDYSAHTARMKDLRQRLKQEVKRLEASVKADYEAASRAEALLRNEYDSQKAKLISLQNDLVNHHILTRDLESNKTLYEALMSRMKDASVAGTMVASNVSIITPAKDPYEPWLPKLGLFMLLAVIIGSMFGVGAAFFVEYMDDSIKTTDEMEKICHIPSLGMTPMMDTDSQKFPRLSSCIQKFPRLNSYIQKIPMLSSDSQNPAEEAETVPVEILSYADPLSMLGEAIQQIRTSILLSVSQLAPKVIMVTSGSPAEGKTTVSTNLAAALASSDRRCVILDCDLRKARIHKIFQVASQPGLTNYITGSATFEEIIHSTMIPNLYFIPAGPTPPNPNELFNSAVFENLINQLRGEFDHIIIDSPPIIGFADGRTISTVADGVILVIKHHFTTLEAGRLAIQLLSQNNTRILGGVLTMINKNLLGYGAYYGYYKNYNKYYNAITDN